jgi:hypothetical protein
MELNMARVNRFHLPRLATDTETHVQQRFHLLSNFNPFYLDSTGFLTLWRNLDAPAYYC